jgi:hypothetical protein
MHWPFRYWNLLEEIVCDEEKSTVYAQVRNNITQDKITISASTQQLINIFVYETNQTVQTFFPYNSNIISATDNGLEPQNTYIVMHLPHTICGPNRLFVICAKPVARINAVRPSHSSSVLLYISRLVTLYYLFIIICLCVIVCSGIVFIYTREF